MRDLDLGRSDRGVLDKRVERRPCAVERVGEHVPVVLSSIAGDVPMSRDSSNSDTPAAIDSDA